jgi:hypothetical protein
MKPQERRREKKKMNSCFFVDEEKSHVLLKDLVCGKSLSFRTGRTPRSDDTVG